MFSCKTEDELQSWETMCTSAIEAIIANSPSLQKERDNQQILTTKFLKYEVAFINSPEVNFALIKSVYIILIITIANRRRKRERTRARQAEKEEKGRTRYF